MLKSKNFISPLSRLNKIQVSTGKGFSIILFVIVFFLGINLYSLSIFLSIKAIGIDITSHIKYIQSLDNNYNENDYGNSENEELGLISDGEKNLIQEYKNDLGKNITNELTQQIISTLSKDNNLLKQTVRENTNKIINRKY